MEESEREIADKKRAPLVVSECHCGMGTVITNQKWLSRRGKEA